MPAGTNASYSAAGTRGYVRVGVVGLIPRYSTGSIALNSFTPTSRNEARTWWLVGDFDYSSNPSSVYMLPCDKSTFSLGDDLYKSAEDAVPGTMRVKASRCGAYSFKIDFPLLITNHTEIIEAYDVISTVVQRANYMMSINTSIQNRNYSCILESFSISADGYGGANPINCQLSAKGLSFSSDMNMDPFRRSLIEDDTRRDKENRILGNDLYDVNYPPPDVTGTADDYSGRLANIKDCALSLNNTTYQQIVSMDLNIQHELKLASTAKEETAEIPTIRSADRMFLVERTVKGSFKFLSSYASAIDLSSMSTPYAEAFSLADRAGGQPQWASPLYMAFGPNMIFNMPAVYWQPRIEELSTGSPLVTINFIARSNVRGVSEFVDGLQEDL